MSEQRELECTKETWVYIGSCLNTKQKLTRQFLRIESGEVVGNPMLFDLKKTYAIGGMYEIEVSRHTESGLSANFGSIHYLGQFADGGKVEMWNVRNSIAIEKKNAIDLEKKYKNSWEIPADYTSIVRIFRKLNYRDKEVFGRMLLQKLHRDAS